MEPDPVTREEFEQVRSDSGLVDLRDARIDPAYAQEGVWVEFRVDHTDGTHWHGAWHRVSANWVTSRANWCWDSCVRYKDYMKWQEPTKALMRLTYLRRDDRRAGRQIGDLVWLPLTSFPSHVDYEG